jgi:DNA-binding MarR family transcriptional regulator
VPNLSRGVWPRNFIQKRRLRRNRRRRVRRLVAAGRDILSRIQNPEVSIQKVNGKDLRRLPFRI